MITTQYHGNNQYTVWIGSKMFNMTHEEIELLQGYDIKNNRHEQPIEALRDKIAELNDQIDDERFFACKYIEEHIKELDELWESVEDLEKLDTEWLRTKLTEITLYMEKSIKHIENGDCI